MFDFRLAGKHYTNVSSFFPFSSNTLIVFSIYIEYILIYILYIRCYLCTSYGRNRKLGNFLNFWNITKPNFWKITKLRILGKIEEFGRNLCEVEKFENAKISVIFRKIYSKGSKFTKFLGSANGIS